MYTSNAHGSRLGEFSQTLRPSPRARCALVAARSLHDECGRVRAARYAQHLLPLEGVGGHLAQLPRLAVRLRVGVRIRVWVWVRVRVRVRVRSGLG